MTIDILTAFPPMFSGPFGYSIVKRAQDKGVVQINLVDLRQFADDKYNSIDDRPYSGGPGMILRVDIIDKALSTLNDQATNPKSQKIILLDAGGGKFTQGKAQQLAGEEHLILICGHYEGVDHRVHEHLVDEVISIGDYVLSGGEIPAMVMVDTIVRLLPGAVGNAQSLVEESHNPGTEGQSSKGAEYPQYTRPDEYKGWTVPEVLKSGDPKKIREWRQNLGSRND